MTRTLCLVLDDNKKEMEQGFINLPLITGTSKEIDEKTIKYEDSSQIRADFKDAIEEFLQRNKAYIEKKEQLLGRKFNGSIVLIEEVNNGKQVRLFKKRVLYKKHLIAFEEIIEKYSVRKEFREQYFNGLKKGRKKLFLIDAIFYYFNVCTQTQKPIKKDLEMFKQLIKKSVYHYDILRIFIDAYEEIRRTNKKFDTIDSLYDKYKKDKTKRKKNEKETINDLEYDDECKFDNIDGFRFPIEERVLCDIDDKKIPMDGNGQEKREFSIPLPDISEIEDQKNKDQPDGLEYYGTLFENEQGRSK